MKNACVGVLSIIELHENFDPRGGGDFGVVGI